MNVICPPLRHSALIVAWALLSHSGGLKMATAQNSADKGKPAQAAAAVSEPIQIKTGLGTLAGTLHLPKSNGPHPAIIFIHGDGPTDRTCGGYYKPLWDRFLSVGYACMSWDKPGVGQSTSAGGGYSRQSYFQRAVELRRALDYLKARPDIDRERIGCWGISQAGWIVPMVASRTKDIAFIIVVSCPGQTAAVQSEYCQHCRLLDEGASQDAAKSAAGLMRFSLQFLPSPAPSEAFWEYLAGKKPGYTEETAKSPEFDGSLLIDPAPLLERVTCPVLAIFGAKDRNVDAAASARVYQQSFEKAGNKRVTIKTFADADHILFATKTGSIKEMGSSFQQKPYVAGYLDVMSNWLRDLPTAEAAKE